MSPSRTLLVALTPVLLFTLAQLTGLSRLPAYSEPGTLPRPLPQVPASSESETPSRPRRLGVITFVDDKDYMLWGVYSIHTQLKKFNMIPSVTHIALVAKDMKKQDKELLEEWLGPENVREIDKTIIRRKVDKSLWSQVFSKIEFFNMTNFDKLITLDNDIFIRQNLMHWFDYPTPAATQGKGTVEWNSGAMVIEPDTQLFNTLLEYIPLSRLWKPRTNGDDGTDTWNSGDGQQGFLSAFFTSNVTDHKMFTMGYHCSVLSSDLDNERANHYFWRHRNHAINTMHFTMHKPWKQKTQSNKKPTCAMLREWTESVKDAPRDRLPELPDYLRSCDMDPPIDEPPFFRTDLVNTSRLYS
jgi:hypothetical protein